MNKHRMFTILLFSLFVISGLTLISCGSKDSPTGGKADTDKPVVVATLPEEFGEINEQKLEISFSKPIDRTSLLKGIYFYPPILNKKIYYDANVITIKFLEALEENKNYFVTLTTRIKDIRGNPLDKNQTLIYRSGRLQDNRISGNITFEEKADASLPVQFNLFSPDSVWIMTREFTGNSYAIEGLNPISHQLKAYIDKNKNGRYDPNQEPYFDAITPVNKVSNLDVSMAYADTVLPNLKTVRAISNREYELVLNKQIKSYGQVTIHSLNKQKHLPIMLSYHDNDRITVLTAETDTTKWVFNLVDAIDAKGNKKALSKIIIPGTDKADKISPMVVSSLPRSGTSVADLTPVLEVTFSEVIPLVNMNAVMKEAESNRDIPFKIVRSNHKSYLFQPEKPLSNYRSCVLIIEKETCDIAGNQLKEPYKLVFLPIIRSK